MQSLFGAQLIPLIRYGPAASHASHRAGWVRVWLQDEASSTCLQPVRWNAHEQYTAGTPGRVIVWYALGQIVSFFSSKLLFKSECIQVLSPK